MRSIVQTDSAPGAIGPYSQGVVASGRFFFSAGQIPLDPETGEMVGSTIEEQARQGLTNLAAVVKAAGGTLENVVKVTVFLQSMEDFPGMNGVYAEFFRNDPPARSAIEVSRLPKDALVEFECIALLAGE